MMPTPNLEDEFWPYMQESRTSIVEKLVTASRTAQTVGRGVLSGGERVAVAFVLDRPDWLAEDRLTLAEALERITPDWLAALPDAARRMKAADQ
jgi:hypothetical protein